MVWILILAVAAGVARHLLLFLMAVAGVCVAARLRRRVAWLLLALVACGAAALGARARTNHAHDCDVVERVAAAAGAANVALEGTVSGFPQATAPGTAFDFTTSIDGRRVRLLARGDFFNASYGDRYRLRARFIPQSSSMRNFIAARGVAGVVRVRARDVTLLGRGGDPLLRGCFWPLHRFARTRLSRAMGADAGLAIGMLLGERAQLARPVRDAVRRLGITHLLAISGMHLTTVAGCVLMATRLWPRGRAALLLSALTVYTLTVGSVESLTRAYVMAAVLIASHAVIRPVRPIDALARALLLMAVASPLCLRSVGLQLSFAATFAVLLVLRQQRRPSLPRGRRQRWSTTALRSLGSAFVMSLAVEVFIAPLQLHHFHSLSAVGPAATVVFFVPVTLLLLGAVPVVLIAAIAPAWEGPGHLLGLLSLWTTNAFLWCGRLAPGPLALPEPNPWLYYGALVAGWAFRAHAAGWLAAVAGMTLAFWLRW